MKQVARCEFATSRPESRLERYSSLHLKRPWRYEVRATKGRQEVVESDLVRDVDGRKSQGQFFVLGAEQVVCADTEIEEMTRSNPRGLVSSFSVPSAGMRTRKAPRFAEEHARMACVELANVLPQNRPICACWSAVKAQRRREVRNGTCYQTTVVAPGKVDVGRDFLPLLELILNLCRLLELLIVIDPEDA